MMASSREGLWVENEAKNDTLNGQIDLASWLWLAASILLAFALRIPFFSMPMLADEGGYAWATQGWVDGTGHLYDDLWISRPQGIFLVYAGIFDLFGTDTVALRFASWIAVALTIIAVWGFTRLCATPGAANCAAIILAITASLPSIEGYSANAEVFMGLPAAFAAFWLLRIRRTGWSIWQLTSVGLLIGVSTSLKPSGLVMLPVALIFIIALGDGSSRRERWMRCLPIIGGVVLIGVVSLIHGWYLGWDDFFYATISYRLTAQSAATVGIQHNIESIARLTFRVLSLALATLLVLLVRERGNLQYLLQIALHEPRSIPKLVWQWRERRTTNIYKPRNDGRFLLHLWLIGALLGAAIGGDWWSHYLIQLVAPLSIWLACSVAVSWPTLTGWSKRLYTFTMLLLLLLPFWVLVHGSPRDMAGAMFSHPGYPAQEEVAAYLRDHSEPGETIFVAFDQASIYFLANRPPAYRHLYDQELRGIPESYADIISIIQSPDRPKFIVSTRQPGPFADDSRAFWQEVGQFYEVVATIADIPIYQDKSTIEN